MGRRTGFAPMFNSLNFIKNQPLKFLVTIRPLARIHIAGITLFPCIFLARARFKRDQTLINHESIHLRQQLELLILPFYIWYLLEYLILRMSMNHKKAYRNIIFEREAYTAEADLDYLKKRKLWQFLKFYKT